MKLSTLALVASAAVVSSAQNILQFGSGQLPSCAQNCAALVNSQTVCAPPAPQPATCFCNTNYLAPLKAGSLICADTCPNAADQQQIKTWYTGFCVNGGSASYKPSSAQTAGAATATSGPAAAQPTVGNTDPSTSAGANTGATSTANQTWWDAHGRWIIMVAVLIVAFGLIIAGGIWWKKRADLKRDRASKSTLPTAWGPSQNQHPAAYATSGPEKDGAAAPVAASPVPGSRNFSKPNRLSRLMGNN